MATLIACEFASMMVLIGYMFHVDIFTDLDTSFFREIQWTVDAFVLMTDSAVAMTLVVLIYRMQSGFKATTSITNRLIQYVIGTTLITFCISIAATACSIASPLSVSWLALDLLNTRCEPF